MRQESLVINVFYSYVREDKDLRDQLERHLSSLRGHIDGASPFVILKHWHDREILPGENWEQVVDNHLDTADIIFLLISPDFMVSNYCYGKEMQRALERNRKENCCVIPILLRPTYIDSSPFNELQILPANSRPITLWTNRDAAFFSVVKDVKNFIRGLMAHRKTKEDWLREGQAYYLLKRYTDALAAYMQAIRVDPTDFVAYNNKGNQLRLLGRFEEALVAYEQAIRLNSSYAIAYNGKGLTLHFLGQYEEALPAYEQAINYNPNYGLAYYNMGNTFQKLGKITEAQHSLEQARRLGYTG